MFNLAKYKAQAGLPDAVEHCLSPAAIGRCQVGPPPRQGDAKLQWQEFPFRLHLCMLVFSPTIILLVFYFLSLFLLTYKISMYLFAPPYSWLLVKEGNRLPFAAPPVCTVPRALPAFIPVKSPVCLRPCLHGDICSWEGRLFGAGASL